MSDLALQHVVVRMLYDRAFADSVFDSPHRALEGVDLSEHELAWIQQTDRRAFRTDPHRRARSLTGLLEEYPTATAALVRVARRDPPVAALDEFFSSEEFHSGMQAGRSLAISFGEYLVRTAGECSLPAAERPRAALPSGSDAPHGGVGHGSLQGSPEAGMAVSLATLELAIARLRRVRLLAPGGDGTEADPSRMKQVRSVPTIAWVEVHPDTLDRFGDIRQRIALQEIDARAAIVDPQIHLGDIALGSDAPTAPVLLSARLEPSPASGGWMRVIDVELSPISEELASVLNAALPGIAVPALLDQIRSLGADDSESFAILSDLVRDGLLVENV